MRPTLDARADIQHQILSWTAPHELVTGDGLLEDDYPWSQEGVPLWANSDNMSFWEAVDRGDGQDTSAEFGIEYRDGLILNPNWDPEWQWGILSGPRTRLTAPGWLTNCRNSAQP